jgi:hypothetical protein
MTVIAEIAPSQLNHNKALSALSISSLKVLFSFTYNLQHFNELKCFVAIQPLNTTRSPTMIGSRLFWTYLHHHSLMTGIVAALY